MSELKPCPFCGGEPVVEGNLVACNNLNCPTHDNYWTDPMIFTCDQWNTRPIEDALNARIAELKELLDTEIQLSNQFYLLLVDNPKSKKLADDLIEALRINGKEVQE